MPGAFSSKRCFLFDLDGTLIDSNAAHARAFTETLSVEHPELAKNFDYQFHAGRPTREVFRALGFADEPLVTSLSTAKQTRYRQMLERGEVLIFSGMLELLDALRRDGRRLFLVTGASRASTHRVLEATRLLSYFEGVVTAEDSPKGKPEPDPYLHVLSRYHLSAEKCLAIEDGAHGIASARAAGLDVIAIHTALEVPGVINVRNGETFLNLLFP